MAGWIGPTIAISLLLIAICIVGMTVAAALAFREAQQAGKGLTNELAELRHELAPMLNALNRFGDVGADVVEMARQEVREVVATSQGLRTDVRRARRRIGNRLADLDAFVEVMQEEVEDTALEAASTLRTLRTGGGVVAHVGRRLVARRRSRRDDEE